MSDGSDKPACAELLVRLVAMETALASFKELMEERDKRYAQQAASQEAAVKASMQNSKFALEKADTALEKRLDSLNELRGMLSDQSREFARSEEVRLLITGLERQLIAVDSLVQHQIARGGGIKELLGYIVAFAGVAIAGIATWFHHS